MEPSVGPDSVNVYRLATPDRLAERAAGLRGLLQAANTRPPRDVEYRASGPGGFKLIDHGLLWAARPPRSVIPDSTTARKAALHFIARANELATQGKGRAEPRLLPFPAGALRHVRTTPEISPYHGEPDHWFSLFRAHIPVVSRLARGQERRAPVQGGTVELRVGEEGRILAVASTLRPWTSVFSTKAYAPPPTKDGDGGHHGGADQGDENGDTHHEDGHGNEVPQLLYVLATDEEPQTLLAPYYARAAAEGPAEGGHRHRAVAPACRHALTAEIATEPRSAGTELVAIVVEERGALREVEPGSDLRCEWLHADLSQLLTGDDLRTVSERLELREPGLYHVELVVEDRATGSIATTYQQVTVPDPDREGELPPAPGGVA